MAYKNTAVTVCIQAWDVINGVGKTGDSANFTLRGVGDGSEFTPSSPSTTEVDSVNLPGVYKVSLTAGENNYSHVLLGGISSTAGIVIRPIQWTNEATTLDEANGAETSLTIRQALRLVLAATAGKLSGAATTTITIRNVGDTKDRITATVDTSGNRTAVTTDGT